MFFALFLGLLMIDGYLASETAKETKKHETRIDSKHNLVKTLGLTDLALTTEARYTRHPSISDPMAPFMDHPGAIEHFPSGSFFRSQPDVRKK